MPRYNNNNQEETAPKIVALDESILFFQKEKVKTTPKVVKQTKKGKLEEEKQNEERKNFELIVDEFMDYWYDRSMKHPAILYHLQRCKALHGFELYYTNPAAFRKWLRENGKTNTRIRAPYPYNLPSGY